MAMTFDFAKADARDLLDVAAYIEQEAHEAYLRLVDIMKQQSNAVAADFFLAMAGREERHRQQLANRRAKLFPGESVRLRHTWPFDVEIPASADLGPSTTLRQALEIALGAEIRAQDFYADALQFSTGIEVADVLENLRQSEVEHQRLVREQLARLPA
jgi:rubrerythrin